MLECRIGPSAFALRLRDVPLHHTAPNPLSPIRTCSHVQPRAPVALRQEMSVWTTAPTCAIMEIHQSPRELEAPRALALDLNALLDAYLDGRA